MIPTLLLWNINMVPLVHEAMLEESYIYYRGPIVAPVIYSRMVLYKLLNFISIFFFGAPRVSVFRYKRFDHGIKSSIRINSWLALAE